MNMKSYHYDGINSQIRYIEDGVIVKTVYGVYAETADITFIMKDMYKKEKLIVQKVIGFIYGNEVKNLKLLEDTVGKVKAEFR